MVGPLTEFDQFAALPFRLHECDLEFFPESLEKFGLHGYSALRWIKRITWTL